MYNNNPALRLYTILNEGKKISRNLSSQDAWAELFNINKENDTQLIACIGKFMELPRETVSLIKTLSKEKEDEESHKYWIYSINTALLKNNFKSNWGSFIDSIDSHTINYIKMTSDYIDAHINNDIISQNTIDELRCKLQDLFEEILASDLEQNTKIYLAKSLRNIINSLDEHRITGTIAAQEGIESIFGHALLNGEFRSELQKSKINLKVWEVLFKAAALISVATSLPQLSSSIIHILTK